MSTELLSQANSTVTQLSQRAEWARGQPISELMSRALANPQLISLAAGFVDQETLPSEPTRKALEAIFSDPDEARAALQYGTTPGYPPLREALLDQILAQDELSTKGLSIDQIVVTAGSNQFLHLLLESMVDPGDIILCASPTYLVILGTLRNIGARSFGVTTDKDGMVPEALEDTLRHLEQSGEIGRVKAIYLVPYFDNPCGITMPIERKAAIVEIAKRWSNRGQIQVIDDAAYRELRYQGEDVPGLLCCDDDGDTVILAGTFSKSFSPGIRIGWGVLPEHLIDPVCDQKGNIDFGSPNFSQHLMARILQMDLLRPHIQRIRVSYQAKLKAMLDASETFLGQLDGVRWRKPSGGLYVWAELPEHLDTGPDGPLFEQAIAEGVLYVPGQFCYPQEGEPVRNNTMRLSFGVQPCEQIRSGIQALSRAIQHVM